MASLPPSVVIELGRSNSSFADDSLLLRWHQFLDSHKDTKRQAESIHNFYKTIQEVDLVIFLRRLNIILEIFKLSEIKLHPRKIPSEKDRELFLRYRNQSSHCFDDSYGLSQPRYTHQGQGRLKNAESEPEPEIILGRFLLMKIRHGSFLWRFLFGRFREDDYLLAMLDCSIAFQGIIYTGYKQDPGSTADSYNDPTKLRIFHHYGFNTRGWISNFTSKASDAAWFDYLDNEKYQFQKMNRDCGRFAITKQTPQGFEDKPGHFLWLYHNVYKIRDTKKGRLPVRVREYHSRMIQTLPSLHVAKWTPTQWQDVINIPLKRLQRMLDNPAYRPIHCLWSENLWCALSADFNATLQAARITEDQQNIDEQINLINGLQNDFRGSIEVFRAYAREWETRPTPEIYGEYEVLGSASACRQPVDPRCAICRNGSR